MLLILPFSKTSLHTVSSFRSTSVLSSLWSVLLLTRYASSIGFALRQPYTLLRTVPQTRGQGFHGDPAERYGQNTQHHRYKCIHSGNYTQNCGAPRQSPLQNHAVDAHSSFRS